MRTRARTGTCQGCMAWATTPPPLTEKPFLLPQNPVLIFQHRLWMSDGAVGSQRGVTNALFNCCLHVCIHVHGPAHLQQSTPPWMGKAGACQGLTLTSHGHDGDKHKAGRPHMPPCLGTTALTMQLMFPGSGGLHSPISEWEMAPLLLPRVWCQQREPDHWEPGPNREGTRLISLSATAQGIVLRGSSNAGVWYTAGETPDCWVCSSAL